MEATVEILVFGKPRCARCDTTKNKLAHYISRWGIADKVTLQFHDMKTVDGLTEAAYNDISEHTRIPVVIIRQGDHELRRYTGIVPKSTEIRETLRDHGITTEEQTA